ncbi:MAG: hypothetical protein ACRDN9_10370 [Streptosporangiaceae bacterium]
MRLTRRVGNCENGPCPNIFDTDVDGLMAVQGKRLVDAEALAQLEHMPDHEAVVVIPRDLLDEYARTRGRGSE